MFVLESLFDEVTGLMACNFNKKIDPHTGVFLWISQMFENSFLYGTPPVAGSENGWKIS